MENRKNHRSRRSDGVRRQIRLQNYVELYCGSTGNTFRVIPSVLDALNRKNQYLPQTGKVLGSQTLLLPMTIL